MLLEHCCWYGRGGGLSSYNSRTTFQLTESVAQVSLRSIAEPFVCHLHQLFRLTMNTAFDGIFGTRWWFLVRTRTRTGHRTWSATATRRRHATERRSRRWPANSLWPRLPVVTVSVGRVGAARASASCAPYGTATLNTSPRTPPVSKSSSGSLPMSRSQRLDWYTKTHVEHLQHAHTNCSS